MKYTPTQIKQGNVDQCSAIHGWIPARGINHEYESMLSRLKNAIGVLTGKYDVLDWQERT